ncbi:MAG: DUF2924 domain-containing protein [Anaerolineales bacterium]|nr:DUF2924 domain-containing protein [Anaerolineales bacterium]
MAKRTPLVTQHLERISREALEEYQDIVKKFVRGRQGVYALYRGDKLYYVGLAGNLRNRLRHHLKDRHGQAWDRFSVYLTIGDSHLKELESLILRIIKPSGNRMAGKFLKSEELKWKFRKAIREVHRLQENEIIGKTAAIKKVIIRKVIEGEDGRKPILSNYKNLPKSLRRKYKGKTVRAYVRSDGSIAFRGKRYLSPSKAAAVAIGKGACNGWAFWYYQRSPGDWVKLDTLRR